MIEKEGPAHMDAPDSTDPTESVALTTDVPLFPNGGDPRRRQALHHVFRRRRRWSRDLDALLGVERRGPAIFIGDYWRDTHMSLTVAQREAA